MALHIREEIRKARQNQNTHTQYQRKMSNRERCVVERGERKLIHDNRSDIKILRKNHLFLIIRWSKNLNVWQSYLSIVWLFHFHMKEKLDFLIFSTNLLILVKLLALDMETRRIFVSELCKKSVHCIYFDGHNVSMHGAKPSQVPEVLYLSQKHHLIWIW